MTDWTSLLDQLNSTVADKFGKEVTYIPTSGPSYAVSGVLESGEAAEERFASAHHALWIPLSSLGAEPAKEDAVEIDARRFRVADVQREPADAGGVWLLLVYVRS